MSFPRYPEYKDSGVEWLGKVPKHWTVCALSYRYEVALGKMLDEKKYTGEHPAPYLRNVDVQWGRINTDDLPQMDFKDDDLERYSLKPGDLLVCEGGEVGRAAVWAGQLAECYYQKALHRLRAKCEKSDLASFFFYTLNTAAKLEVFSGGQGKSTIAHLTAEAFRRYLFAFPPRSEQLLIQSFLTRELTKIDNLMAEQEKLIALLKEKRQAVIAHAVTKGLDPTAPMKDSGVEWLGEVPAHWQLKRVKHFVNSFDQGWSPQCESYPVAAEDEWGVLKVGCVNGGIFNPEENKSLPAELDPLPELGIRKGDLLISRANTRELVGSAAVVLSDYPNLLLCDKLYRLRLDGAVTSTEFVAYYLSTGQVRGQIELSASGASSSMLNISQATILEMAIALPADEEQKKIVVFIESAQIKLNGLIAEAQHAIDLLKERRTALISAAVTGQIDVRGLVKDEQEQAA